MISMCPVSFKSLHYYYSKVVGVSIIIDVFGQTQLSCSTAEAVSVITTATATLFHHHLLTQLVNPDLLMISNSIN